jgi:hypothetical protein
LPKIAPYVKHIKLVKPIYKDANAVFSGLDKFDLCLLGVQFSDLGRVKKKRKRRRERHSAGYVKHFLKRFYRSPLKQNPQQKQIKLRQRNAILP